MEGCSKRCLGKLAGEPLMTQEPLDVPTGADHWWAPYASGTIQCRGGRALGEGFTGVMSEGN